MRHFILIVIIAAYIASLALLGCTGINKRASGNNDSLNCVNDTLEEDSLSTDTELTLVYTEFYTYTCEDGHSRSFGDVHCPWSKYRHMLYVDDEKKNEKEYIHLIYGRYEDVPDYFDYLGGIPDMSHYRVSKDKKNLYVVTRVHANSNGWTREYQLFIINCETLEWKFLCECAAIATTDKGFTIAVARLTNEDTAKCTADEIWLMHDEHLDWNGNVTKVSKKEYKYDEMKKKYFQSEYTFIKGFSEIV